MIINYQPLDHSVLPHFFAISTATKEFGDSNTCYKTIREFVNKLNSVNTRTTEDNKSKQ
jgi:hypothetical protein